MSLFVILLGGDLVRTERLDRQIAGARVIAADSGMRHALALDLRPELWIGDFDSTTPELEAAFPDTPRAVFPTDKDKTDGELAINTAIARGATSILLAGAFGGSRADHAFLHLTLAIRFSHAGMPLMLSSGDQEGHPLQFGAAEFAFEPGTVFSVLGFTHLSGLTIEGAKWPLNLIEAPFGSSLTLSNVVEGRLRIFLGAGTALLLAHIVPV